MNWDAVGAVGELLGSIAVLATLIYVAVQVRHARHELTVSLTRQRRDVFRQLALGRRDNPMLSTSIRNARNALSQEAVEHRGFIKELIDLGLSMDEAETVHWDLWSWWSYRAQVISSINELPIAERIEFDNATQMYHRDPVHARWYKHNRGMLNPDAVKYVDALLNSESTMPQDDR